eukprot:728874-Hanusia_phi.AAC.1
MAGRDGHEEEEEEEERRGEGKMIGSRRISRRNQHQEWEMTMETRIGSGGECRKNGGVNLND